MSEEPTPDLNPEEMMTPEQRIQQTAERINTAAAADRSARAGENEEMVVGEELKQDEELPEDLQPLVEEYNRLIADHTLNESEGFYSRFADSIIKNANNDHAINGLVGIFSNDHHGTAEGVLRELIKMNQKSLAQRVGSTLSTRHGYEFLNQ